MLPLARTLQAGLALAGSAQAAPQPPGTIGLEFADRPSFQSGRVLDVTSGLRTTLRSRKGRS